MSNGSGMATRLACECTTIRGAVSEVTRSEVTHYHPIFSGEMKTQALDVADRGPRLEDYNLGQRIGAGSAAEVCRRSAITTYYAMERLLLASVSGALFRACVWFWPCVFRGWPLKFGPCCA